MNYWNQKKMLDDHYSGIIIVFVPEHMVQYRYTKDLV